MCMAVAVAVAMAVAVRVVGCRHRMARVEAAVGAQPEMVGMVVMDEVVVRGSAWARACLTCRGRRGSLLGPSRRTPRRSGSP